MPTTTNTLPKKRRRRTKGVSPRLPQPSPSTPSGDDPLFQCYRYPPVFDILFLRLQMIGSVNGKHAQARGHIYINREYARREQELVEDVQKLVAAARWQVAKEDSYCILYSYHFDMPVSERQLTGDNHNPLKPFSDILVKGKALYDDNNTRAEWVASDRETGDDHWATIVIYRFFGEFPPLPVHALIHQYLLHSYFPSSTPPT